MSSTVRLLFIAGFLSLAVRAEDGKTNLRVLHEQDFTNDPGFEARPGDMVWLGNQLPATGDGPVLQYRLDAGRHSFCLNGSDQYYTGIRVRGEHQDVLLEVARAARCRSVELKKGHYTLQILHSNSMPDANQRMLVTVDEPSRKLTGSEGTPLPGYWALSTTDASGAEYSLRANAGLQWRGDPSAAWDENSLISFPANQHPIPLGPARGYFLDASGKYPDLVDTYYIKSVDYQCGTVEYCDWFAPHPGSSFFGLIVSDLGNDQFALHFPGNPAPMFLGFVFVNPSSPEFLFSRYPIFALFNLEFRYFPAAAQLPPLVRGEAALFGGPDFAGDAILADHTYDPTKLTIDGTPHSFSSIKLADDTAVQLKTDGGNGVPAQSFWVVNDTPSLPNALFTATLIAPLDAVLNGLGTGSFACANCRLAKTNLSNFVITGANWQSADMTGATLTGVQFTSGTNLGGAKFANGTLSHVSFRGASLAGADFSGAKLTCVDFSGTSQNPADLTKVAMASAQWLTDPSCRNDLSYTRFYSTSVLPVNWKNLNLTGASIVDLKQGFVLSSQAHPLDLSGAMLAQVNFEKAYLDYANLASADLTDADMRQCRLTHATLSSAKLLGANLNSVNLDGANMNAAFLDADSGGLAASVVGAFLRNVNLSHAQMSGANFTDANFFGTNAVGSGVCAISSGFAQGCASAAGATLNNTVFSQAFLFGVDFSKATIQGVQFGNAVLIGANFDGAQLTSDTQVGTGSGFPGAFLQGTSMATANKLLNISLVNAYLDFSQQGNAFTMSLNGNHTVFPGAAKRGQPVCVQMVYVSGTSVPTNNASMTCPDGSQSSTGCGATVASNTAWASQVDISSLGTYQFDATYTPASQQQFCQPDDTWFTGGFSSGRK